MLNRRVLTGLASTLGIIGAVVGCQLPGGVPMVVIGDSLSAGFQNDSLLDSQQPHGWASLAAKQAGVPLTLPLIAPPGAPAVLQLISLGPPPVIEAASGTTTGRTNPEEQPLDLAVPGQMLADVINDKPTLIPTSDEDIITDLVLGFPVGNDKSQMNEAIALQPRALFVWVGSDDALQGDEAGTPEAMTPVSTFTTEFQQLIGTLRAKTSAVLVVANIPDVTVVPYLTPATTIIAEVAAETGLPAEEVGGLLGIQEGDLINATGLSEVQADLAALESKGAPVPLTDSGFLDPTEIAQVQSTVNQYNSVIAQQVQAAGGILVDIHKLVNELATDGVTINNYHATAAFLGGLFSLDGIHPTNTGYALIANAFIDTVNAARKTSVPDVDVSAIAASDPLFGPNIKPAGALMRIPTGAATQSDRLLLRHPANQQ